MLFEKLEIEYSTNYSTRKKELKGRIHFKSENNDWFSFTLDEEYIKAMLELSLPLFERAMSEKVEIVRREVNGN